ncbi:hypothetical protein RhiJN_25172 [Ceratobasidium sp. AG-Ba]|nr:hypothetical protein RhiJN_25172 [Ceratobasidium sp. AG-Ba]
MSFATALAYSQSLPFFPRSSIGMSIHNLLSSWKRPSLKEIEEIALNSAHVALQEKDTESLTRSIDIMMMILNVPGYEPLIPKVLPTLLGLLELRDAQTTPEYMEAEQALNLGLGDAEPGRSLSPTHEVTAPGTLPVVSSSNLLATSAPFEGTQSE